MLTAEGCRQRRERLWQRLEPKPDGDHLRLSDPIHLAYLANFHVDPFSLGADYGGLLELHRDGTATLWHDSRLPKSVEQSHVDKRDVVVWYDGQSPGRGPRRLALRDGEYRIHDRPGDPLATRVTTALAEIRRCKDPDEIALLKEKVPAKKVILTLAESTKEYPG